MSNLHPPLSLLPILRRICLALVFVCALGCLFSINVKAATIGGTITDIDGLPVADARVGVYKNRGTGGEPNGNWSFVTFANTNIDGEYALTELGTGTYSLFFAREGTHVTEYYNDKSGLDTATTIVIADAGSVLSGYDAVLAKYGRVVGKVTNAEQEPIEGIQVTRRDENGGYTFAVTDYDAFTFTDVLGDFELTIPNSDPFLLTFSNNANYEYEYYDNAFTFDEADSLTVLPDQTITLTIALSNTKTMSGTVVDGFGVPVDGVEVKLHQKYVDSSGWFMRDKTYTDTQGKYSFSPLPRAEYRLEFSGETFLSEYYMDKATFDEATILDLRNGPELVVVDAHVTRFGVITGTVTDAYGAPAVGASVKLYKWSEGQWLISDLTYVGLQGDYKILAASPGVDHRIRFDGKDKYTSKYFGNADTVENAQTIVVPAETLVPNINGQIDRYGIITGTLTNLQGKLLPWVKVRALDPNTGEDKAETSSDYQGNYSLSLEPNQPFVIVFVDYTYRTEYFDDQLSLAAGTVISAPLYGLVPNINAQLTFRFGITGTVTDNNGIPIVGIPVTALDEDNAVAASVVTNENGVYDLRLGGDLYRLGFNTSEAQAINENYVGEYYENASSLSEGTEILFYGDSNQTIHAELAIRPSISGQLRFTSGEAVPQGVVDLYKRTEVDGVPVMTYELQPSDGGYYALHNIPPGEYILHFYSRSSRPDFVPEYYQNQDDKANATILTVTDRTILTNIDAVVARLGNFVGTVVNEDNVPLPGIQVWLYGQTTPEGNRSLNSFPLMTDANGQFELLMYPSTPTWLEFIDPASQYAREFYNNTSNIEDSEPITVALDSTENVVIQLGPTATITGHVTFAAGTPPNERVHVGAYVYWPFGSNPRWHILYETPIVAYTDANGDYRLEGLSPNARYRLVFSYRQTAYPYPFPKDLEHAQDIVIPTPSVLPNINMTIIEPTQALADFSATPRNGTLPLVVDFTDETIGNVVSWQWDFGNGATSVEKNPRYTYTTSGVYTVTLNVSTGQGGDDETKVGYITVGDTPITNVGIEQNNPGGNPQEPPKVGETLYFSATAAGSNVEYLWDFGDDPMVASTAIGQYVQHSYDAAGVYVVTLTAHNEAYEEIATMSLTVQANENVLRLPHLAR